MHISQWVELETFIDVPLLVMQAAATNISDIPLQSIWIGAELIAFRYWCNICYGSSFPFMCPQITSWLNDCEASVLIYALVINDAKRIHTYITCTYRIYRTQWSIHMNTICKYDSHPVTQSFTRPALLFTHTQHTAHKSETTKETINRVLLSWTEKLVSTLSLPLCMHFVVLLAFWSIAE